MFPGQPKTQVYKFGYQIDSNHIQWKSDVIKNEIDFRRMINDAILNSDRNQFNSIVVLAEISSSGGISLMSGNMGTTYAEFNLMAQLDSSVTNKPPTAKFKRVTLNTAIPMMLPGTTTMCQQLYFTFDKGTTSWEEEG